MYKVQKFPLRFQFFYSKSLVSCERCREVFCFNLWFNTKLAACHCLVIKLSSKGTPLMTVNSNCTVGNR